MDFFGVGPMELLFILIIAFLVFGPQKLPEIGRQLGKAVREFRKYSSAMTKDIREEYEKEVKAPADLRRMSTAKNEEVAGEPEAASSRIQQGQP